VQACLLYYAKYPEEIDDAIEENRQLTWEAVRSRLSSVAKRA
jgi:hypothetical protein